jgi:tRNA(His) 5'-end guanylyltransferase
MKKDSLGDRMKSNYEDRQRFYLTRRTPVIMRLDGKAFHTVTKKAEKPYDVTIINAMQATALKLLQEIQGAKCAYIQSDEISILITDFDTLQTEAWFDYNLNKMVSISAAIASVEFSKLFGKSVYFDSRVFNIPKEEVTNYFRWRYLDWVRNSIQMLAQSLYSQKQLHGKNTSILQDMCMDKGINWSKLDPIYKNGTFYAGKTLLTEFNLLKDTCITNIFINNILYKED